VARACRPESRRQRLLPGRQALLGEGFLADSDAFTCEIGD